MFNKKKIETRAATEDEVQMFQVRSAVNLLQDRGIDAINLSERLKRAQECKYIDINRQKATAIYDAVRAMEVLQNYIGDILDSAAREAGDDDK